MRKISVVTGAAVILTVFAMAPASGTIHPIVQSIACAAAQARENVSIADPVGQTPAGLSGEIISVSPPFLTIAFPDPLVFDQSDFRALIATGFIDEVVTNADGEVTSLIVDLRSVPKAASGQGGANCANGS